MEAIDILFIFIMLASAVVAVFYRIYCESFSGKKVLAQHVPINNYLINLDPSMNVLNVETIMQTDLSQPSTFHVELRKGASILWQKEIKAYSESSLNLRVPVCTFSVEEPGQYVLEAHPTSDWTVAIALVVLRRNVSLFSVKVFSLSVAVFLLSVLCHILITWLG